MEGASLTVAQAAQERSPDESLISQTDTVATYEPPPTLPLPESFFARPTIVAKTSSSAKVSRLESSRAGSFHCPTEPSAIVVLALAPRVVTTVIGPQGDELRFTGSTLTNDQLVRKTMQHGDVLFCLKRASVDEKPVERYVLKP